MARERLLMADGPQQTPEEEGPITQEEATARLERAAQERETRRAQETQPAPTENRSEQPQATETQPAQQEQQREASETPQAYSNELLTQLNIARNFPQERDRIFDERYPTVEVNLPDGTKEVRRPSFDSLSAQDRQRITAEIDAQAIRNLQANSQMGAESPFDEAGDQVEFDPRTQDEIWVRTALGRRRVIMPKTDQGKIDRMREVLGRIEATKDADGGEVNRLPFQEITQVINTFREDKDPAKRKLAQTMYSELDTRTTFHSIFLQYQKAGDAAAIFGTLQQLRADQLRILFGVEGVKDGFNFYENRAEEVIRASSNVTRQEELMTEFSQDKAFVENLPLKRETRDKVAPVRIAERLWEITGRRAMHDRLEVKDPAKDAKSQIEKGDVQFIGGSLTGGNFAERRILRVRDYMRANIGIYNPQIQLLDGVDLKTNDFITNMVGDIENDQKKKFEARYQIEIDRYLREGGQEPEIYRRFQELYNRYFTEGFAEYNDQGELRLSDQSVTKGNAQASREKAIKRLAEIDAYNQTKEIFGGLSKVRKRVESSGQEYGEQWEGDWLVKWEERSGKWAKRKVLLDASDPDSDQILEQAQPQFITKIRWDLIDFGALGDNPMLGWSLYSVQMPDAVRPLLMGEDAGSYLRKPTYDSLKAMDKTLIYLTTGWKEAKTKLLENLVVFQRTEQRKALSIPNISYIEGDEMIINAVRDNFITRDERGKVDSALGKTGWLGFLGKKQLALHLFNPLNFIVVAIWDAIKKGSSTK